MKHRDLIAKIRKAARLHGVSFEKIRQRGSHEMWRCGTTQVVIPKHNEVNEITAESVCKTLEAEFGERWWR
ncbi:MAG: type II toxin-antitoxin system HicA family toxin [Streptomyces sp.]|uniref:type II toxin-antitoxin system HicA family toxin n=1 Tax=Streptomyces sp. TaxID=1931 RepID=UPI003D6A94EE